MASCTASPRAAIAEPADFPECLDFAHIAELLKNFELTEKVELTAEEGSRPLAKPIDKLSMTAVVWDISRGQLGLLPGPASSQLLHT